MTTHLHKPIKRFQVNVEFQDDSDMIRVRAQYESLLVQDMRNKGYIPVLDMAPHFSVDYDNKNHKWKFFLTVFGTYIGKKRSWEYEGTYHGRVIRRTMLQDKLKISFKN